MTDELLYVSNRTMLHQTEPGSPLSVSDRLVFFSGSYVDIHVYFKPAYTVSPKYQSGPASQLSSFPSRVSELRMYVPIRARTYRYTGERVQDPA